MVASYIGKSADIKIAIDIEAGILKVVDIKPWGPMGPSKGVMNSQGVERGSLNNQGVGKCLPGVEGPFTPPILNY